MDCSLGFCSFSSLKQISWILLNNFNNFLFSGWKDSILSLPKKWLSQTSDTDEYGFPEVSIGKLYMEIE
jgi:hypothetical protein